MINKKITCIPMITMTYSGVQGIQGPVNTAN